jgi:hypothetical protein
MFFIYKNYYNAFNEISLYNITESICSSLITKGIDKINLINYYKQIIEIPLINIKNISELISAKNNGLKELELDKVIIKNINVITRILKQTSFIEDKSIINSLFDIVYTTSFSFFYLIIQEYISNSDIVTPFLKMLTKASSYFNNNTINKIFLLFIDKIFKKKLLEYKSQLMMNLFQENINNFTKYIIYQNDSARSSINLDGYEKVITGESKRIITKENNQNNVSYDNKIIIHKDLDDTLKEYIIKGKDNLAFDEIFEEDNKNNIIINDRNNKIFFENNNK